MIKEAPKPKKKKAEHQHVDLKESLARAFQDVLRNASRHNEQLAISIEGKIVVIDAKKLRSILAHHNGHSIESEILQYAQTQHS
jgi:hypothetical protein